MNSILRILDKEYWDNCHQKVVLIPIAQNSFMEYEIFHKRKYLWEFIDNLRDYDIVDSTDELFAALYIADKSRRGKFFQ